MIHPPYWHGFRRMTNRQRVRQYDKRDARLRWLVLFAFGTLAAVAWVQFFLELTAQK